MVSGATGYLPSTLWQGLQRCFAQPGLEHSSQLREVRCLTYLAREFAYLVRLPDCNKDLSSKTGQTRVSHKKVPQKLLARKSHRSVLRECFARAFSKNALQEPKRAQDKSGNCGEIQREAGPRKPR